MRNMIAAAFLAMGATLHNTGADASPAEEVIEFAANSGETAAAFQGALEVPENRADPDSRKITLRYVRFPATGDNPGAPIVYLAGGPGGSGVGTAKGRRFPLFMAMREFGDVIALDQRGTGASDGPPRCVSSVLPPEDRALSDAENTRFYLDAIRECAAFWKSEGVDLRGYNTVESAKDLDALRAHLGAEKITLWGISYGSHLAFAAIKNMEPHIDRVVLASAEGLDQTVKLPARTDAYFDRLQALIDQDAAAKEAMPDIKALMRRVHAKLDQAPVMIELPKGNGETATVAVGRIALQSMTSGMIADPENAVQMMWIYLALDNGISAPLAGLAGYFYDPGEPISLRGMSLAMDIASGISDARLRLVNEQAKTAILRDYLNFPMPQARGAIDGLDLGGKFRKPPKSDVPVLLFSGTLDGRTYVESQREAVAGLKNTTIVEVVNAGHNLFMSSPDVTQTIQGFMRGETIDKRRIEIAPPAMTPRGP